MTGKELVAFARSKLGTAYVYGMKGKIMTEANFNYLLKTYPKYMPYTDRKKIGKVCVDCSGLISWATGKVYGSGQLFDRAVKKELIRTVKDAPVGALVWMKGHVGIYSGMRNGVPYYIAADGSKYGVREVPLSCNKFTHWLLMDYIDYEEDEEMKYNKLAEVPKWGKPTVEKLISEKLLVGDGKGNLNIYESALQVFVVMDRKGLL